MLKFKSFSQIKFLIVHTAAAAFSTDVGTIRRWHQYRGFLDIGYHWVIRGSFYDRNLGDSLLLPGRDMGFVGAHASGANSNSFGVALTGHGDINAATPEQLDYLFALIYVLSTHIPGIRVIGHSEIDYYYLLPGPVSKTCPGIKNNMDLIRRLYVFYTKEQPIPKNISRILRTNETIKTIHENLLEKKCY